MAARAQGQPTPYKDPLSYEYILVEDQQRQMRFERECPHPIWYFDYTEQEHGPEGSAIIGSHPYQPLAEQGIPCVVAGFEPLDVLQSVYMLARMHHENNPQVLIQYDRVVKPEGNPIALSKMNQVFEVTDTRWRGLGEIPASGLRIRDKYSQFDAQKRFTLELKPVPEPPGCDCGAVLRSAVQPTDCSLFGTTCRPDHPVGSCMVSSEGACAALYRYQSYDS